MPRNPGDRNRAQNRIATTNQHQAEIGLILYNEHAIGRVQGWHRADKCLSPPKKSKLPHIVSAVGHLPRKVGKRHGEDHDPEGPLIGRAVHYVSEKHNPKL